MKRRLNILCLIVIFVLSYSVLEQGYYVMQGIKAVAQTGVELKDGNATEAYRELANLKVVDFVPSSLAAGDVFNDSVYNKKSERYVPAAYSSLMVSVDTHDTTIKTVMKYLLVYLHLGFCIWALMLFVRLVVSVNKSEIFNWLNVRRLRKLGMAQVICFCSTFASSYLDFVAVGKVFEVRGYDLTLTDMVDITTLLLGLTALIVAEVFAIGLKMKEEQELTI